jgi:periplasmic protein CpxP/Spy
MNRNKLVLFIIGLLLVSNLVLAFLLVNRKPGRPDALSRNERMQYMHNLLQKEVGFSVVQLQQFDSLRTKHMSVMQPLMDSLRLSKEQLFNQLSTGNDSTEQTTSARIGYFQANIDRQMLTHLREVRQLCTNEQQPAYDTAVQKITRRLVQGYRKPDGNRRKPD